MPSSTRKERYLRRQKKLVDATPTSHAYSSPHPYHDNSGPPAPPGQEPFQGRSASTETKLSDATMEDRSVFEYSDTSDDADAYFNPTESLRGAPGLLDNYNPRGRTASGESAFREMKSTGSRSTKIVRFSRSKNSDGMNFADEDEHKKEGKPLFGNFMKQMVHAFNTPDSQPSGGNKKTSRHNRSESHDVTEYPYSMVNLRDVSQKSALKDIRSASPERSPLLGASRKRVSYGVYDDGYDAALSEELHPLKSSGKKSDKAMPRIESSRTTKYMTASTAASREDICVIKSRSKAAKIAAYFLMDYEASRVAALPSTFDIITEKQLYLYETYYSWQWRYFVNLAIILLFLAHTLDLLTTAVMHSIVIVVLAIEIYIREGMYGVDLGMDTKHPDRKLVRPMIAFLFLLGLETWLWYYFSPKVGSYAENPPIFSSFLKPVVLFYVSAKARDSLEAIWRIGQIVIRVLLIEFFLILIFAALAQGLFGNRFEDFMSIPESWISLFKREYYFVQVSI